MSQGLTYDTRQIRFSRRPVQADCRKCRGRGAEINDYKTDGTEYCKSCGGSGLDAIPWAELFKLNGERGRWRR